MYVFYEIFIKNVHFLRNFRKKCNFVKSVMVDELNIKLLVVDVVKGFAGACVS